MADEKLLKEIGRRIYLRRKELELTQEQLAEQMEVSIQMISNLELGKKAIRPENIVKVCKVLNISADYILTGERGEWELNSLVQKIAKLSAEDQKLLEKLIDRIAE